jgi:hypothetical protein
MIVLFCSAAVFDFLDVSKMEIKSGEEKHISMAFVIDLKRQSVWRPLKFISNGKP